uniref:Uncharacterized protein n=1 Tax=Arundo donax TaxID=35708 RepID=A0A0A9AZL7_ARUDO
MISFYCSLHEATDGKQTKLCCSSSTRVMLSSKGPYYIPVSDEEEHVFSIWFWKLIYICLVRSNYYRKHPLHTLIDYLVLFWDNKRRSNEPIT